MNQFVNSLQTNDKVKTLMKQFDRYHFCVNKSDAYIDKPSQFAIFFFNTSLLTSSIISNS